MNLLPLNLPCARRVALAGVLALLAAPFASAQVSAETPSPLAGTTILIIRHAEKPADGGGLHPFGEKRAAALADYFKSLQLEGKPLKIDALFAAADSKGSQRSRLTLEPMSQALGLPLDLRFGADDGKALAEELRTKDHGRCILICWHHGAMPELLRELGANPAKLLPKGEWPDGVFNWVLTLRYDAAGRLMPAHSQRFKQQWSPES